MTVMDLFFLADVVKNFNVGYIDGVKLVMTRSRVTRTYVSSWFLPDLISSVPVDLIFALLHVEAHDSVDNARKGLKMMRLVRARRRRRAR